MCALAKHVEAAVTPATSDPYFTSPIFLTHLDAADDGAALDDVDKVAGVPHSREVLQRKVLDRVGCRGTSSIFGDGYGEAVDWDVVCVCPAAFALGEVAELERDCAGRGACGGGEGDDSGAGVVR